METAGSTATRLGQPTQNPEPVPAVQVASRALEIASPSGRALPECPPASGFPVRGFPIGRRLRRVMNGEAGMATAEYAIATLAAVGLAGLLVVLLRSDEVRGFLLNLIRTALSLP